MNLTLEDLKVWSNPFDDGVAHFFSSNIGKVPFLDQIMAAFSSIGTWGLIWIIFSILFVCFPRLRKLGIFMIITLAFSALINEVFVKEIFDRSRPFVANPTDFSGGLKVLYQSGDDSFPSGHTVSSFAMFASSLLFFLYEEDEKTKKLYLPIMILFACLATLIAFSRVYLVHHYLTDVLAGMAFGLGYGTGFYYLEKLVYNWIKKEKAKKIS